jgi:DNA-3-methyladenine glycosylase II
MARGFTIVPRGPFSLELAAGFGFGPRLGEDDHRPMRLAFAVDGLHEQAGVTVRQDEDGVVRGVVYAAEIETVRRQVARILSLDQDGEAWLAVGERDPIIARLQDLYPGLRPVLFHSPYEAAAWALISARQRRAQAVRVRERLATRLGRSFDLAGRRLHAFPLPDALAQLDSEDGPSAAKAARLRALAARAQAGELEAQRLAAMGPQRAKEEVQELDGIGPFYASLIVLRACGLTDALADEPRLRTSVAHYYGLDTQPTREELEALAEPWRPFRTWVAVLVRFAATREGLVRS